MQISEKDVPRLQHRHLRQLRLLHLDNHLRLAEDRSRVGNDPSALGGVIGVGDRRALPGAGLDDDLVAGVRELVPQPQ